MCNFSDIDFDADLSDHENHRALWTWLAANPGKRKATWPGFGELDARPMNNCFACKASRGKCDVCPITWVNDEGVQQPDCCFTGTLFSKWYAHSSRRVIDAAAISALALQIADLPWNE